MKTILIKEIIKKEDKKGNPGYVIYYTTAKGNFWLPERLCNLDKLVEGDVYNVKDNRGIACFIEQASIADIINTSSKYTNDLSAIQKIIAKRLDL